MLKIEKIWGTDRKDWRDQARALWQKNRILLDPGRIEARSKQVVYGVFKQNILVGVSTAEPIQVKLLNNHFFYEFRCFIDPEHRLPGLDVKLAKQTFDTLEDHYLRGDGNCIGVVTVLENDELRKEKTWRRAVWPVIHMVFVGYTTTGMPIRVYYFKGARI